MQQVDWTLEWEIIIVNNNSNDNTKHAALTEWVKYQRLDVRFQVVDESKPGLRFAREKGIEVSLFDYIIFCDDDNWLLKNYVNDSFHAIHSDPQLGIIGGVGIAKTEIDPPEWFQQFSGYYAIGPQNVVEEPTPSGDIYVYGAGAVVRKSIFGEIKAKSIEFIAVGRTAHKLSSGEDVELCYLAQLLAYKIGYNENLKFYHFIEKNRLNLTYIRNLAFQFGYCNTLHRPYYWLFNRSIADYKKTWVWVLLVSLHIYLVTLIRKNFKKKSDHILNQINLAHASGRISAVIKLNFRIDGAYGVIKNKFKERAFRADNTLIQTSQNDD